MYNRTYNSVLGHRHIYDKGDAGKGGPMLLFSIFYLLTLVQANLLKNVLKNQGKLGLD